MDAFTCHVHQLKNAPRKIAPPSCAKHRYPSKKDALTAINQRTRGHQRNRPRYLRAFYCPRCHGWHLTHQPDRFA